MLVSAYEKFVKGFNTWKTILLTIMVLSVTAYCVHDGYGKYFAWKNPIDSLEPDPTPGPSPTPEPTVEPSPEPILEPSPTPEPTVEPTPSPMPSPSPVVTPTPPPALFNASIECFDLVGVKRSVNTISGKIKWKCAADKGSTFNWKVKDDATPVVEYSSRITLIDSKVIGSTFDFSYNPCNKLIENRTVSYSVIYFVKILATVKSYHTIKLPAAFNGAYKCK